MRDVWGVFLGLFLVIIVSFPVIRADDDSCCEPDHCGGVGQGCCVFEGNYCCNCVGAEKCIPPWGGCDCVAEGTCSYSDVTTTTTDSGGGGGCTYKSGVNCYCEDGSMCCNGVPPYSNCARCGSDCKFRNFDSQECSPGQMLECNFNLANDGLHCVNDADYISECSCSCPPKSDADCPDGYKIYYFGTDAGRCAGKSTYYYTGECTGCNNPYFCIYCCIPEQITTTTTTSTTTTTTVMETCDATDENDNCWELPPGQNTGQRDSGNKNGVDCDCEYNPDKYGDHRVVCDPGVDEGWTYKLFENNDLILDSAKLLDSNKNVIDTDLRDDQGGITIPWNEETYYILMEWRDIWKEGELARAKICHAYAPGDEIYCNVYDITFSLNIPKLNGRKVYVEFWNGVSWEYTNCNYDKPGQKFCNLNNELLTKNGVPDLGKDVNNIKLRLELISYPADCPTQPIPEEIIGSEYCEWLGCINAEWGTSRWDKCKKFNYVNRKANECKIDFEDSLKVQELVRTDGEEGSACQILETGEVSIPCNKGFTCEICGTNSGNKWGECVKSCDLLCSNLGYEYETCDETIHIPSCANGQCRYEGELANSKGECSNYCYCYDQVPCDCSSNDCSEDYPYCV